ncbi:MAG: transposase [Candidatus Altiarchaeales archaeon]|nr:transposase [Candidatus Altiarchaeota archaeon]MCG2782968.1 transposase [Candidatus Altiarchaeales archaeon]
MKNCATIKIKLPVNDVLLETIRQYSNSAKYVVDVGYNTPVGKSKIKLHNATYREVRKQLPQLPAQLVISSRDKAYEILNSVRMRKRMRKKASKPQVSDYLSIRYDARSFYFKPDVVSLTSVGGRLKIPIQVPKYFGRYLGWTVRTADLIYRKGKLFLNVVVSRDITIDCSTGKTIGVDVGINNLAVTSERQFFKGVKGKLAKFHRLRGKLQAKGTRSARRKLKRVSGRQRRFMADLNHRISKGIVEPLDKGDCIVMEDLNGIRNGVTIKSKRKGKVLNRMTNNWAFYQLQGFIDYKASRKGVWVVYANPHYTSKTCSNCGEVYSIRPKKRGFFRCLHCGFSCNSDLNASRNLRERLKPLVNSRGLHVNQPIVASDDCKAPLGELSMSSVTNP